MAWFHANWMARLRPRHGMDARWKLAACLLLALAPLALWLDLPLARWCLADGLPGDLRRVLTWAELMAHGVGVGIVIGVLYVLDPLQRGGLPRLAIGAYGAGLFANVVKLFVGRTRPHHFEFDDGVWATFTGWFPWLFATSESRLFDSRIQSFPSAHSAVAFGFAVGLCRLYPHGRYLFVALAVLAAAQRIAAGAHYLSDTMLGAAIGIVTGLIVGRGSLLVGGETRSLDADVAFNLPPARTVRDSTSPAAAVR